MKLCMITREHTWPTAWALLLLLCLIPAPAPAALQDATEALRNSLATATAELRNDHYANEPGRGPGVPEALSGSSPDSLLNRLSTFSNALDERLRDLAGHSGTNIANSGATEAVLSDIDAMILLSVETNQLLLRLSNRTGDLLARIALDNRYDSLKSPVYQLHKARLLQDLAAVSDLLDRVDARLSSIDTHLGASSPLARLELDLQRLTLNDNHVLNIEARATNHSAVPLSGISLVLNLDSPADDVQPLAPEEKALDVLAANDGMPSGPDETTVTWQVPLLDAFLAQPLGIRIEAREQGATPTNIRANTLYANLAPPAEQEDTDNDGLPDAWERTHRLNPHIDDAGRDEDDDGLENLREFLTGTDPRNADSDGDGLGDGEELQGLRGHRTDPLLIDTDGDGTDDLSDASPRDAGTVVESAAVDEPKVSVDTEEVILDDGTTSVKVHVTNAGGGILQWAAVIEDELVADLVPGTGALVSGDGDLEIRWPDPAHDFADTAGVVTTVRVVDATGDMTDFRTIRVCHRVCDDRQRQHPPGAFELVYPDNGAIGLATQLQLIWKQSRDPNGDNIRYQVMVCTDPDFVDCLPRSVNPANKVALGSHRMLAGLAGGLALFGFMASASRSRHGRRSHRRLGSRFLQARLVPRGGGDDGFRRFRRAALAPAGAAAGAHQLRPPIGPRNRRLPRNSPLSGLADRSPRTGSGAALPCPQAAGPDSLTASARSAS